MKNKPILPKKWSADLAYLFGLLTGDGSLPIALSRRKNGKYQKRYPIIFYSISLPFLREVYLPIFKKLFKLEPKIHTYRKVNFPVYATRIESIIIYNFLRNFGFTIGRKSKIAKVPKLPKKLEVYLLAGLLDTDGGKKGSGFGLSTASPHLAEFCIKIFKELGFSYHSCPWHYNGHIYHQIYVHKRNMHQILEHIPLKSRDQIKFIRSYASVAQPGRASHW